MRKQKAFLAGAVVVGLICAPGAFADTDFTVTADIVYGHKDGMALTYDVIQPAEPNGAAVLFMVSGGWFSRWSPPEDAATRFTYILDRGYTLYMVRHGSAPRYKVPEAVADVQVALHHIHANASDFGVDPDRLGVFGGSAGGHLSLMLACATSGETNTSEDYETRRPAAIVAYFPPVDLRQITGPNDRFPALDFEQKRASYVSPLLHVSADDPPILLVHGDKDDLVPISASEAMYAELQKKGVTSKFVVVEGGEHGFRGKNAREASNAMMDWFDSHLAAD